MKEGKAIEVHEYEAIRNTLKYYVNGAFAGKSDIMKNAFHELAQIYGQLGDQQFADPIQALYTYVDEHPPAEDLKYAIRSVDRSGDAATARIEITNWHGHTFTDFFTLLKIDQGWVITNKIFTLH